MCEVSELYLLWRIFLFALSGRSCEDLPSPKVWICTEGFRRGRSRKMPSGRGFRYESDRAVVLFLPPYEVAEDIEDWYARLPKHCTPLFGKAMRILRADPPYQDDDPEGVSYYVKPSAHRDEDMRRKDLRRHILASIAV